MKLYKLASVSLYVSDSQTNMFSDLFSICTQIESEIYRLMTNEDKRQYEHNRIDPVDSTLSSSPIGKIQIPKNIFLPERYKHFVKEIYKYLHKMGMSFTSEDSEEYLIIDITFNPKADDRESFHPELNLNNTKAYNIFVNILEYGPDVTEHAKFDTNELRSRCESALTNGALSRDSSLAVFRENYGDIEHSDAVSTIRKIIEICDWAIRKNKNSITIA